MNRTIHFTSTGDAQRDLMYIARALRDGYRPDDRTLAAMLSHCVDLMNEHSHKVTCLLEELTAIVGDYNATLRERIEEERHAQYIR